MGKRYRIAIYLRLSKEDEDIRDESNSITNQRAMLKEYVSKNFTDYKLKEFVDDGFSGTNFRRPGVMSMLEQVRDGEFDCVIVKDFSRFSRDYIELGSYLDQIFPFLGVRFLSLNDRYDSSKNTGNITDLDISFKGLMYDLYSKDLSLKVKSSLQIRKKQGQYTSANAPFGYRKDPNDRHRLLIAEDEAELVKRIFLLTSEGKTSAEIARQFNQEKIPTPIEFKIKKGRTRKKPLGDGFQWEGSVICSILRNPVYIGDMVYDKYYRDEVGGKNHLKPRSEWKIYKNHHEAIVSREFFEKIQRRRKQEGGVKARNKENLHPLQGKVFCGGCRRAMVLRKRNLNPYFSCYHRYVYTDTEKCVSNVNLMFLEQFVLYKIGSELSRQKNLEKIRLKREYEIREKMDVLIKESKMLYKRKAVLQRKRLEEYEKNVFGEKSRFQTEDIAVKQIEEKIDEIDRAVDELNERLSKRKDGMAVLLKNGYGCELTTELVEALIQKIIVYDEAHIEIVWKFETEENAVV